MSDGISFCPKCNTWTEDIDKRDDVCVRCEKRKHNLRMRSNGVVTGGVKHDQEVGL